MKEFVIKINHYDKQDFIIMHSNKDISTNHFLEINKLSDFNLSTLKLSHLDKIVTELPKHKDINIQTNYGNKYSIELQLNNTIIMHKNGSRVYSTNK